MCVCLFASNFGRSISTVLAFRRSWRNINIYIMIICKLSFPQSFSTVLTTRHDKEGMIKRKDNVTTWSWRWFCSYLCWKCFFYLCEICGHDDVMMVMMLVLMVLSLLVWNMWTDSVAVRHQRQTALHQTVIFIFISFNLFIDLSLYLYLYLNRYTEQDHHHFWNIISITMNQNKFDDCEILKKYYLRMTKILFGRAGLFWAHLRFRKLKKNFNNSGIQLLST